MLDKKLLQDVWEDLENQNKKFFKTGFEDLDCILGIQEQKGALSPLKALSTLCCVRPIYLIVTATEE